MNLEEAANLATIASFIISLVSLVLSGVSLKLLLNIKINISKDKNNNIQKSSINNSTVTQIKG